MVPGSLAGQAVADGRQSSVIVITPQRQHVTITYMSPENRTPISGLFEAHLTVQDLNLAVAFYEQRIGLPLAHLFPERRVAFFWIGAPGRAMLGLWEAGTMPIILRQHVAFNVSITDLHAAPKRLKQAGIEVRDFAGELTEEPVVLAWMPAAAVYFHDPDNNLLEFITMLPNEPRPDLGVLPWSEWLHRMPADGGSVSKR